MYATWQKFLAGMRPLPAGFVEATTHYEVRLRDGALYGGRDRESATVLIPLAPLVFFQKGSIHIMIFVHDAAGAISEVRELHKYNEVVMKRVTAQ